MAEGERQAERERLEHEARLREWEAEERERRRLGRIKQSREELLKAIDSYRCAQSFESFFAAVERRAGELDGAARQQLLEKVGRARALLGGVNALERFSQCVPPEEAGREGAEDGEDGFRCEEHRTVNAFVLESTKALADANAALRRQGAPEVEVPPSTARMLALLKRAQAG